jgi:hypothetical protein
MTSFSEIPFRNFAKIYAIANTPLFLVRKFRADPIVQEIRKSFTGEQILAEMQRVMNLNPKTSEEYVRPYVYLVALSFMDEIEPLNRAAELPNRQRWEWFSYLHKVLYQGFMPTSRTEQQASPQVSPPPIRATSASAQWNDVKADRAV